MANQQYIKDSRGVIMGFLRTEENGDIAAVDFDTQQVLGYYRVKYDHTTDFRGVMVSHGNTVVSFITQNYYQNHH